MRGRGGCVRGRGRAALRRRGRDLPHRRWQDWMRDKSIQCDWTCTRLVQEAACVDAVATYVDVAGFLFAEGGHQVQRN